MTNNQIKSLCKINASVFEQDNASG